MQATFETPVGPMTAVVSDAGVKSLTFGAEARALPARYDRDEASPTTERAAEILAAVEKQVHAYFAGELKAFDLPLAPDGTAFQKEVWKTLQAIPFGSTTTYGKLAEQLGDANRSRAIGAANGRNPIAVVVPCHRVIGADGSLTGFAGGLAIKRFLLDHETAQCDLFAGIE